MTPRATILVVDDNEANRLLAQGTLEDEDYVVILAKDGAEGIASFERQQPDCVLLDVRMPGLDGFAVCQRIRALPGGAETPILFLTAARDVDTFDRALAVGGDDFLTKPVQPNELVVRVASALELRRVKSELRAQYDLMKRQRDDLLRIQLQKERLTAFVVHDLKNPVNAMDLHAQLIVRDKTASDDVRAAGRQIRTEAHHLTRMILNLLDVSKADEGQLTPKRESVDLSLLVQEVFAELDPTATASEVELGRDLAVTSLAADRDLLRRLLANLVENAIRYAPAGSAIVVGSARSDDGVLLSVADRGSGIPPSMRERIFDAFVRVEEEADAPSRQSRGLGLSFCKVVALAHGGSIWVEDLAPGTRFCVSFPTSADPSR